MKHQDLDPCPFCGGKAEKIPEKIEDYYRRNDRRVCSCGHFSCRLAMNDKTEVEWFQIENEELAFEIFVDVFEEKGDFDIRIYRLLPKEEREKGAILKFTDHLQMIENIPIINVQEAHEYLIRWAKLRSFE